MKYDFLGVIVFGIVLLIGVAVIAAFITVGIFLIRALSRYVKSGNVRKEKSSIKKSLGEVLKQHREECKMTQEFVAESIGVSRQAVSKWETGDTIPNTETLKRLSKLFDVSINTLLGSPRELICQCCGMPLADDSISREKDGFLNEDYCKWCYADGVHLYSDMEDLIEVCVKNMPKDTYTEEEVGAYLRQLLPQLEYWKRAGEK